MYTEEQLWTAATNNESIDLSLLSSDLQSCVLNGDGVADHYGGRTDFTFLDQKNNRILTLEREGDGQIRSQSVINMSCGYGTGILGDKISVIGEQLSDILNRSTTTNDEFHSVDRSRLVATVKAQLADHTDTEPDDWEITFTSTGSEAMDLALQLAYLDGFDLARNVNAIAEKDVIVACHGAWHGWSLGTNQMLDRRQFTDGLPRVRDFEVVYMQYGDTEHLSEVFESHKGRIRAVFVEGILGDGGVIPASNDWWSKLFDLAKGESAKIFDDEILTGFRTGSFLAIPKGSKPDCISLGKALGFGLFPMSALAWRKDKLSLRAGIGVRTFNARPFQAAVVNAGVNYILDNDLISRASSLGEELLSGLQEVQRNYPEVFKDVRGRGLFVGLELSDILARRGHIVRDELLRYGVLSETESGLFSRKVPKKARINETIRLTPPLTIDEDVMVEAIERISNCAKYLKETQVNKVVNRAV